MNNLISFLIANWPLSLLALVLLFALIVIAFMEGVTKGGLSPQDAVLLMSRKSTQVIDLRNAAIFNDGHIINADRYEPAEIKQNFGKLFKNKDKNLIFYCGNGQQSASIVKFLKQQNFTQVNFINGGLKQWQADNLPITK